jgi:hypothetical protein
MLGPKQGGLIAPSFRHITQNTTPSFGNVFAEKFDFSLDKTGEAWYNLRVVTGASVCLYESNHPKTAGSRKTQP